METFLAIFKWIMLVSGLLTCTMFLATISPQMSLESNFGSTLTGPVAEVVVRNWGALIGLVGIMLVYGSFAVHVRKFALVIGAASKATFIVLVITYVPDPMRHGAGVAVVADSIMIVLYIVYLFGAPKD
ncbi:MAG TPA: hypothetical protein VFZ49_06075 [Pyrinomonadaceae bacterium]